MKTAARTRPIQLDYYDEGRAVVVTPADQDRFLLSVEEAATACAAAKNHIRFAKQFEGKLLPRLAAWLKAHAGEVHKAFLTVREGGLLFLVVRRTAEYDAGFSDALTELDTEIAQDPDLGLILLDVLALPNVPDQAAVSFLNPERVMVFTRA